MVTVPRLNLAAFPDSPYAAELQRGYSNLRFSPTLEAEYVRAHLLNSRTLIRVVCVLGTLLAVFRGVELAITGSWASNAPVGLGLVIAASIILTSIAWSPAFERLFLPWARIIVPARNAIVAAHIAQAAALGQLEMLMILPIMLIGPFFFLGLRFRTALFSGVLTVASFIAHTAFFELALAVALRSGAFVLMALVACAIAARHLRGGHAPPFSKPAS